MKTAFLATPVALAGRAAPITLVVDDPSSLAGGRSALLPQGALDAVGVPSVVDAPQQPGHPNPHTIGHPPALAPAALRAPVARWVHL